MDDWFPFRNRVEFEVADFVYRRNQMSASQISDLMDLWAAFAVGHGLEPPFSGYRDVYDVIDSIPHGDVSWQCFSVTYDGTRPDGGVPDWMESTYDVWYRDPHRMAQNMLASAEYHGKIDYAPYRDYGHDGERLYGDFMSGDWAWQQAVFQVFIVQHIC